MEADNATKPSLSFSFSRKVESKKLQDSKLREDSTKDVQEEMDFVKSFEDKQINSTIKKEEKKGPLVIPLIQKNQWRLPPELEESNPQETEEAASTSSSPEDNAAAAATLEERAARELITESTRAADDWESRGDKKKSNRVIPMFIQNKIPEGYETEEKIDASLRAEEASLEDYDKVPVDEYGLAMLRGMGWKPGQGIGNKNQKAVAPMQVVVRAKGLGLGADKRVLQKTPATKEQEEELTLRPGSYITVENGPEKGMYGQVQVLDEDNTRCIVQLVRGGVVAVSNHRIKVVTKSEFQDRSRIINLQRYDEYKKKEQEKQTKEGEERRKKEEDSHKEKKHHRTEDKEDKHDRKEKRKKEESEHSRKHGKKKKKDRNEVEVIQPMTWVHPQLRVRCIDREYKKGKYYSAKMVIIDVASERSCTCKAEDGRLLDLSPDVLETVIPKSNPAYVMIVAGKHKGQVGEILSRDKARCRTNVQLLPDRDEIVQLDYDFVCEYTGDISHL